MNVYLNELVGRIERLFGPRAHNKPCEVIFEDRPAPGFERTSSDYRIVLTTGGVWKYERAHELVHFVCDPLSTVGTISVLSEGLASWFAWWCAAANKWDVVIADDAYARAANLLQEVVNHNSIGWLRDLRGKHPLLQHAKNLNLKGNPRWNSELLEKFSEWRKNV
jgi:hypothetical protein